MLEITPGNPRSAGGDLRTLRTAAGLSLRALAAHSGYSTSYLSRVENGRRAITPEIVRLYTTLTGPAAAPARQPHRSRRHPLIPAPRRPAPATDTPGHLGIVWFGAEVRRLRMADGKSLDALGGEVYISRAYLGKIEQGSARGTYQLALSLDGALGARGRLAQLFLAEHARVGPVPADVAILDDPWRPGHLPGRLPGLETADPAEVAVVALDRLDRIRARSRHGPHAVFAELTAGVTELHNLAATSAKEAAAPLRSAALRYAELLGWTAQETGHDAIALRWTRTALDWARAIGDTDAVGYALIRQSQWARRRGAAEQAIGHARAAAALPGISPRIEQFAAQREAQACALAGDESGFRYALDRFHDLAARTHAAGAAPDPTADPVRPQWGPLPDPGFEQSRILEATCLVDLGDFHAAATLFADHMSRLTGGRTGYARLAVREATAYAHLGEADLACEVTARWLPVVARAGSASLRGDLNRLTRILNRHRTRPAVRDLLPDLSVLARAAGTAPVGGH